MMPDDDPLWPRCGPDPCGDFLATMGWCVHVRGALVANTDQVETELRVCVPVVPAHGQYAEVSIDKELIPGSAMMHLARSRPWGTEEELIPLGMWSQGEGRASISLVVQQWIKQNMPENAHAECKQRSHSFTEWQIIKNNRDDAKWNIANDWSILYRDMCIPCYEKYLRFGDPNNFGLNQVNDGITSTPTGNALRNRYS